MTWGRFKNLLFCNWKEKLLAVVLAFLFWYMIKAQIAPTAPYHYDAERFERSVRH